MYSAPFEYHRAGSLDEAIALLDRFQPDAKLLAGGHSLLPLVKLRFAQPAHVIDIRRIDGLAHVMEADGTLVIGALATHRQIETSPLIARRLQVLAEAAGRIGDPQVRNMGTIGGSLAHADPAADLPALMLALEAELVVVGPRGERRVPAADWFVGLMTTALQPNEILREIRIPLPPARTGGAYEKHAHPASRYAVVGVAALLTTGEDGSVTRARVALTGVAPTAFRATATEAALAGGVPDAAALRAAAAKAAEGVEVLSDLYADAEFRAHLARVHTERALRRALERARAA